MNYKYDEVDAAMAALDALGVANSNEFDDTMAAIDILHRNDTVGITMEDGKRLVKMGIDISLDDLGPQRSHVATESALLTEGGKTGLYGLAIGALIVLVGFIIKKIIDWFKGGSDSGSGSTSNKELAKKTPSMETNPSDTMKIPEFLVSDSDRAAMVKVIGDFLDYCTDEITALSKLSLVKKDSNDTDAIVAESKRVAESLIEAVKPLGYKVNADGIVGAASQVKKADHTKAEYFKISTVELFINSDKIEFDTDLVKSFEAMQSKLSGISKGSAPENNTGGIDILKTLTSALTAVLSGNILNVIKIAKVHNTYLDISNKIFLEAFSSDNIDEIRGDDKVSDFIDGIEPTDHKKLAAAFDKMDKAGKGVGFAAVGKYKKRIEARETYQKAIAGYLKPKEESK